MPNRSLGLVGLLLVCSVLVGCGRQGPPPKPGPPPLRPSDIARQDLVNVARRIEDPANFQAIEQYIANIEDPAKGWTWADMNEYIVSGSYSIQTKIAYEKWRNLKIAEAKK